MYKRQTGKEEMRTAKDERKNEIQKERAMENEKKGTQRKNNKSKKESNKNKAGRIKKTKEISGSDCVGLLGYKTVWTYRN